MIELDKIYNMDTYKEQMGKIINNICSFNNHPLENALACVIVGDLFMGNFLSNTNNKKDYETNNQRREKRGNRISDAKQSYSIIQFNYAGL